VAGGVTGNDGILARDVGAGGGKCRAPPTWNGSIAQQARPKMAGHTELLRA